MKDERVEEDNNAIPPELTTKQKQHLKGLAHPLRPVVQIGKEGVSKALVNSTIVELKHHELIKVKIGNNSGLEKKATAAELAKHTDASLVQLIGKTIILFKSNPEKAGDKRIQLPR